MPLSSKGAPSKIISLIKALYLKSEFAVLHNGNLSDSFTTNAVVRQECPLSPLLFAIVLDDIRSQERANANNANNTWDGAKITAQNRSR